MGPGSLTGLVHTMGQRGSHALAHPSSTARNRQGSAHSCGNRHMSQALTSVTGEETSSPDGNLQMTTETKHDQRAPDVTAALTVLSKLSFWKHSPDDATSTFILTEQSLAWDHFNYRPVLPHCTPSPANSTNTHTVPYSFQTLRVL